MSTTTLAVSYFFHLVATVIWVGGLAILATLVMPEARRALAASEGYYALLTRLRKRFIPLTHFSLVVLTVTGLVQMSGDPNYEGVLQVNNGWSLAILLKHLAVVGMFVCGVILQFWIAPALERIGLLLDRGKGDETVRARLLRAESRLTWVNVSLGVLTLVFTAYATAV